MKDYPDTEGMEFFSSLAYTSICWSGLNLQWVRG